MFNIFPSINRAYWILDPYIGYLLYQFLWVEDYKLHIKQLVAPGTYDFLNAYPVRLIIKNVFKFNIIAHENQITLHIQNLLS